MDSQLNIPALILITATILLAASMLSFLWRWSRGRVSSIIWAGLLTVPRRYLVNVHDKVVRRRHVGGYHVATALGILVVLAAALSVHVFRVDHNLIRVAGTLAGSAAVIGVILFAIRRHKSGRSRWHKSLHYISLAVVAAYFGASLLWPHPTKVLAAVAALATFYVFWAFASGPLRHAVAGIANLAFHARPTRFASAAVRQAAKAINLDQDKLGAETRRDFNWNQLVAFDACVECHRCEEVCPAHAAGSALSPMRLIHDVRTASDHIPLLNGAVAPEALWACTTCNACVEACPMFIEHVDAVMDMRRFATLEKGQTPNAAVLFDQLAGTDQANGRALSERLDWAADLNLRRLQPGDYAHYLLWVGDAGYLPEGRRTLRALVKLLSLAKVDYAVLPEEGDIGDIALRLGNEALFRDLALANTARLDRVRFDHIITADPHVVQALAAEYQAIGRSWAVSHHTTFLNDLVRQGQLLLPRMEEKSITYHDPCYLGRHGGEYDAPRQLLRAIGAPPLEMARSRETSFCCGAGGGAAVTDMPTKHRIPDLRMEQAKETGAAIVAVACPNCAVMLNGVTNSGMAVLDVAEIILNAVEQSK